MAACDVVMGSCFSLLQPVCLHIFNRYLANWVGVTLKGRSIEKPVECLGLFHGPPALGTPWYSQHVFGIDDVAPLHSMTMITYPCGRLPGLSWREPLSGAMLALAGR